MSPQQCVNEITKGLRKYANESNAKAMTNYMLGQFIFYGVKKPERNLICKPLYAQLKGKISEPWILETAKILWAKSEREYHYVALDIFEKHKKLITPKSFKLLDQMIVSHSWWDSVDGISSYAIAPMVLKYPEMKEKMERYAVDRNMWRNRISIIHQLLYKERTDKEFLFRICELHMHREEFFIRKAIGWALRQYAKTNRKEVYAFVEKNKHKLSALSYKEALKHK